MTRMLLNSDNIMKAYLARPAGSSRSASRGHSWTAADASPRSAAGTSQPEPPEPSERPERPERLVNRP